MSESIEPRFCRAVCREEYETLKAAGNPAVEVDDPSDHVLVIVTNGRWAVTHRMTHIEAKNRLGICWFCGRRIS